MTRAEAAITTTLVVVAIGLSPRAARPGCTSRPPAGTTRPRCFAIRTWRRGRARPASGSRRAPHFSSGALSLELHNRSATPIELRWAGAHARRSRSPHGAAGDRARERVAGAGRTRRAAVAAAPDPTSPRRHDRAGAPDGGARHSARISFSTAGAARRPALTGDHNLRSPPSSSAASLSRIFSASSFAGRRIDELDHDLDPAPFARLGREGARAAVNGPRLDHQPGCSVFDSVDERAGGHLLLHGAAGGRGVDRIRSPSVSSSTSPSTSVR